MSDLVDNMTRGHLAEFLVSRALGLTDCARDAGGPCDLRTPSGLEIQVKSCAYLQSWGHEKLSQIRFDIRSKRAWDSATNLYGADVKRHAHVYVFCLLHHQDKATLDPLDLDPVDLLRPADGKTQRGMFDRKLNLAAKLLTLVPVEATFHSLAQAVTTLEFSG